MEPGFCSSQKARPVLRWVQCRQAAQDRGGGAGGGEGAGPRRDAGETEAAAVGWLPGPRPSSLPLCSSNASAKSSGRVREAWSVVRSVNICPTWAPWGARSVVSPPLDWGFHTGHVGPAQPPSHSHAFYYSVLFWWFSIILNSLCWLVR